MGLANTGAEERADLRVQKDGLFRNADRAVVCCKTKWDARMTVWVSGGARAILIEGEVNGTCDEADCGALADLEGLMK